LFSFFKIIELKFLFFSFLFCFCNAYHMSCCLQVVPLDAQAAYQLCAVSSKSLLLWDLRAGPAAAATIPLQAPSAVLRAMPGGQVLLSAAANGQVHGALRRAVGLLCNSSTGCSGHVIRYVALVGYLGPKQAWYCCACLQC
jgi:hypothetical protein